MPSEQRSVCERCQCHLLHDPFQSCPRCSSTVGPHLILEEGCPQCRDQPYAFDGAFRMGPYVGVLRDVILRMKHWSGEELAEVIGALWAAQMAPRLETLHADLVIPVPLHWTRRWRRGFNQSGILASCLASRLGVCCGSHVLSRVRRTGEQKQLKTGKARQENVRHAFQANVGTSLQDKTLLLVDDVLTSGATANESARALRSHRPRAIYVVVLAHGN